MTEEQKRRRRFHDELDTLQERLLEMADIVEGLILAVADIDEIIRLIREQKLDIGVATRPVAEVSEPPVCLMPPPAMM